MRTFLRFLWRHLVIRPWRFLYADQHPALAKFFGVRCPHLAGMVAYFALLSMIPGLFLVISLIAQFGGLEATGVVVENLRQVLPEAQVESLVDFVDTLRQSTGSLGLLGAVGTVWGAMGLYAVLESAFNIIYGVQHRVFARHISKILLLLMTTMGFLLVSVLFATSVVPVVTDGLSDIGINWPGTWTSAGISTAGAFLFLLSVYRYLPNVDLKLRDVWRGALLGSILFQVSFQALPVYLTYSESHAIFKAFAGTLILLLWLYLMGNIILMGAVFNWYWALRVDRLELQMRRHWRRRKRDEPLELPLAPG